MDCVDSGALLHRFPLPNILLNVLKFTAGTQGHVIILWSPDVDCQWDKGHFIFGVQENGMG